MIEDYVKFAIDGIRHRRLRAWLTMVGIFIGIFAVVALISLGQGLQAYIDEQFEAVGGDRILISPGGGFMMGGGDLSSSKLTSRDVVAVKRVRGVKNAIGVSSSSLEVKFGKETASIITMAVPTDRESIKFLEEISFFDIERGRFLEDSDHYGVVVGFETGETSFDEELFPGDKLLIGGNEFKITGITKGKGNPMHDTRIVIPIDTATELLEKEEDEYSQIMVKVAKKFTPSEVADEIEKKLRRSRGVKEGEEDFTVVTAEKLVESFKNVLNMVQILLVGIAAISLLVGAVGIMNTMYTSVLERTKQIGIMKSIGARNSDVLFIFLVEAGFLGLVGGIIGVTLGMATSYGIEYALKANGMEFVNIYLSPLLIFGTLTFSFSIGCFAGLLPARQASKMNPIDALRYKM